MKCSAFHELAAAYALDALSEEERIECERHLREEGPHEGCEALLARYEHVVAELATTVPPTPVAPRIWRAIEARLGLDVPAIPKKIAWREPLAWAAAAIALIAGLWSAQSGLIARRERERTEQALTHTGTELANALAARAECAAALAQLTGPSGLGRDAVSLLEHPATKVAPMAPPAGAQAYRATALYNPELKRALVVSTGLQRAPGKDYELWVIAKGEATPRPAGFVRFEAGVALGEFDAQLLQGARPAALAVSLEPAGGMPTPTTVILVAKLQG